MLAKDIREETKNNNNFRVVFRPRDSDLKFFILDTPSHHRGSIVHTTREDEDALMAERKEGDEAT